MPSLIHINCLYVYGLLLIPTSNGKLINGLPSVLAIEIPPWDAVKSDEISWFKVLVVIPSTIFLSLIWSVAASKITELPPTLTFPETNKSPVMLNPLDCEITLPGAVPVRYCASLENVIVEAVPDAVATTLGPTKFILETLNAVPTIEPSSLIVIPLSPPDIALGGAQ